MGINMSMIQGFIDAMTYEEVMGYVKQLAADSVKQNYAQKVKEEFAGYTDAQAAEMFDNEVAAMDDAQNWKCTLLLPIIHRQRMKRIW